MRAMSKQSIHGKVAGYKSAMSQATMRAQACELEGDVTGAGTWRAKVAHWKKLIVEWTAKLDTAV